MTPRIYCLISATDDLSLLPDLVDAGIDGFQVRDKHATTSQLLDLTLQVMADAGAATVVVDDRVDVALASGAHGVHLGSDDLPIADARRIAPGLTIGATCRNRADVEAAAAAGADYAGFGPVFATSSKDGLPDPLGVDAVTAAAGVLPLVAIGGIDASNATAVRTAGAHGVAVIGGIWRHPDPPQAAKELSEAVA